MTRFAKSFVCLNGPREGTFVDTPPDADEGSACCLPWWNIKGQTRYAVYLLTTHNEELGLMYLASHPTTVRAQMHVERLAALLRAAKSRPLS